MESFDIGCGMTMLGRLWRIAFGFAVFLAVPVGKSAAQSGTSGPAFQVLTPVASLARGPFQDGRDEGLAGDKGQQDTRSVPSVIPFSLNHNWRVIARKVIPFVSLAGVPSGAGKTRGIGNVVYSFLFLPKQPLAGGFVWGVGPMFQLPTFTDDLPGPERLWAGITAVALIHKTGRTLGVSGSRIWLTCQQDTGGTSSSTLLQPVVSRSFGQGASAPLNTESTDTWIREDWTVPVILTVAKIDKTSTGPRAPVCHWAVPGGRDDGQARRLGQTA